jgi:hypothetical protein
MSRISNQREFNYEIKRPSKIRESNAFLKVIQVFLLSPDTILSSYLAKSFRNRLLLSSQCQWAKFSDPDDSGRLSFVKRSIAELSSIKSIGVPSNKGANMPKNIQNF